MISLGSAASAIGIKVAAAHLVGTVTVSRTTIFLADFVLTNENLLVEPHTLVLQLGQSFRHRKTVQTI